MVRSQGNLYSAGGGDLIQMDRFGRAEFQLQLLSASQGASAASSRYTSPRSTVLATRECEPSPSREDCDCTHPSWQVKRQTWLTRLVVCRLSFYFSLPISILIPMLLLEILASTSCYPAGTLITRAYQIWGLHAKPGGETPVPSFLSAGSLWCVGQVYLPRNC